MIKNNGKKQYEIIKDNQKEKNIAKVWELAIYPIAILSICITIVDILSYFGIIPEMPANVKLNTIIVGVYIYGISSLIQEHFFSETSSKKFGRFLLSELTNKNPKFYKTKGKKMAAMQYTGTEQNTWDIIYFLYSIYKKDTDFLIREYRSALELGEIIILESEVNGGKNMTIEKGDYLIIDLEFYNYIVFSETMFNYLFDEYTEKDLKAEIKEN